MENKCKICGLKRPFDGSACLQLIVRGGYTGVYAAKDENNKVIIYGTGDDCTDYYYPNYCPECGRKLKESDDDRQRKAD